MINYLWIGLIVVAIVFAGYMDITHQPTHEQPAPVVLMDFELSAGSWGEGVVDSPRAHGGGGLTAPGKYGSLHYNFETAREVKKNVELEIPSDGNPQALTLWVYGDGGGHILRARFTDLDGEEFFATSKVASADQWRKVSFSLNSLAPGAENPAATLDYPLTLVSLSLARSQASPQLQGSISIDDISLTFPEIYHVKDSLKAERWMGVATKSAANWAGDSIQLAIGLIGIMMLWLGLMRIAEKAGLIQFLAKMVKPIMTRLFPDLPPEGEAMGAILMNVAANMLGLGNAATPLGLKAMEELQKLNENKEYASNAMCMLLAMNTSSVTLIPATIIGYRAAAGSTNLMAFWPVMIASTLISTIVAVLVCKLLEKLPIFKVPLPAAAVQEDGEVQS